jgi:hypothetical protein
LTPATIDTSTGSPGSAAPKPTPNTGTGGEGNGDVRRQPGIFSTVDPLR